MQPLLEELLSAGFHVQLQHVEKETSWEDRIEHGYVALIDGETVLAKRDGFQHNGNLRMGGAYDRVAIKELVTEALKKVPASAA